MNDQNLIAIASNLTHVSSEILTYLETKEGDAVRLSELYLHMLQQGVGMQKTPEEVHSLRLALLVRTQADRTDERSTLIEITGYGKRLLELGRDIESVAGLYPDPVLTDETLGQMKMQLQSDYRRILEALQADGFDSIKELYDKVTKGKQAYRIFQSRIAALKTALLINIENAGRRKIPVLTTNGERILRDTN